jgi:hypothetical protein
MSLPNAPVQRVTRYNLILSFEEQYTADSQKLRASADAITSIINAIEALVGTNAHIQAMLAEQHLTIATIAPARIKSQTCTSSLSYPDADHAVEYSRTATRRQ